MVDSQPQKFFKLKHIYFTKIIRKLTEKIQELYTSRQLTNLLIARVLNFMYYCPLKKNQNSNYYAHFIGKVSGKYECL